MRDRVLEILIKAKDLTATALGRFRRNLRAAERTIRDVTRAMTVFTAAVAASVLGMTKLAEQGDKVVAVKNAFARMTARETDALGKLRAAAQGTISDLRLMALANQALSLGAAQSASEFAEMIEIARVLGRAQGVDMLHALESLTTGLARQSPRILDNIGLQVKLGDTTTFTARVLDQARQMVERLGGATVSSTSAAARFSTSLTNLRDRLAEVAAESPLVTSFFDGFTGLIGDIIDVLSGDADDLLAAMSALGRMAGSAMAAGINASLKNVASSLSGGGLFGPFAGLARFFASNQRTALGDVVANREALGAIARSGAAQRNARGRSPAGGGVSGGGDPLAGLPGITGPAPGLLATPFVQPYQRLITGQDSSHPFLAGTAGRRTGSGSVPEAAEEVSRAGEVFAATMFGVAQAAVRGSADIATSVTSMITQIIQSLPGVGGLGSAVIGGLGGLVSAAFSRRDPVPVQVSDYADRALEKLKRSQGEVHVTSNTYLPDGTLLSSEQAEREMFDRQNRDETVRFGANAQPIFGGTR